MSYTHSAEAVEPSWTEQAKERMSTPEARLALKLVLGIFFIASASWLWGWEFAIHVTIALIVHEYGHVLAMRWRGVPTKGFFFIPFLGGVAVASHMGRSRKDEFIIAMAGPFAGGIGMLVTLGLYVLTGWTELVIHVFVAGIINLLNLIPITPLDGGRALRAVIASGGERVSNIAVWFMIGLAVSQVARNPHFPPSFWTIIIVFGAFQMWALHEDDEIRTAKARSLDYREQFSRRMIDTYVGHRDDAISRHEESRFLWRSRTADTSFWDERIAQYETDLDEIIAERSELEAAGKLPPIPMKWYGAITAFAIYIGVIVGLIATRNLTIDVFIDNVRSSYGL